MKYLISAVIGTLAGIAVCLLAVYYNPLNIRSDLTPLAFSDNPIINLHYSAAARDTLLYTNNGESQVAPYPGNVLELWEDPIRQTTAMTTVLLNSRNEFAGIGIKFLSDSERTQLLKGQVLVDSVWHIFLPGRGTLFIEQTENHWEHLRDIVIPAYLSSGDSWRGVWRRNITAGPSALRTARVVGGSGEFVGLDAEAVEALAARAYSVEQGPVALQGELLIEMPRRNSADAPATPSATN
jgi:hypothetical protein